MSYDNKSPNQKATQAYEFYNKGKKPVEVSIQLHLPEYKATRYHFESINNKSLSASYVGLGWFIDTNLGTEVIQHSGGIDGYSSFVGFNPTKQEGIVELCSCGTKDMPSPVIESL